MPEEKIEQHEVKLGEVNGDIAGNAPSPAETETPLGAETGPQTESPKTEEKLGETAKIDQIADEAEEPAQSPLTKMEWLKFAWLVAQEGPRSIEKWLEGIAQEAAIGPDAKALFVKLFLTCRWPESSMTDAAKVLDGVEGVGLQKFGETLAAIYDFTWHRPVKAGKIFSPGAAFHEVLLCNLWNARHHDTDSVEARQKGAKPATCCHPIRPHYLEFSGKRRVIEGADEVCVGLVDGMAHQASCMHFLRTGYDPIRDADLFLRKVKSLGKCCEAGLTKYLPEVKIDPGKYPVVQPPKPSAEDEDSNPTQPLPGSPGAKRNMEKVAEQQVVKKSSLEQSTKPSAPKPASPIQPVSIKHSDLLDLKPASQEPAPTVQPFKKPEPDKDVRKMVRRVKRSMWASLLIFFFRGLGFLAATVAIVCVIGGIWYVLLLLLDESDSKVDEAAEPPTQKVAEDTGATQPVAKENSEKEMAETVQPVEDAPVYESHADITFRGFDLDGVITGIVLVDGVTQINIDFGNGSEEPKDISLDKDKVYIQYSNLDHKVAVYKGDLKWVVGYRRQGKRMHAVIENGQVAWVEHPGRNLKPKAEISGALQFRDKIDLSRSPVLHLQDMEGREVVITLTP